MFVMENGVDGFELIDVLSPTLVRSPLNTSQANNATKIHKFRNEERNLICTFAPQNQPS